MKLTVVAVEKQNTFTIQPGAASREGLDGPNRRFCADHNPSRDKLQFIAAVDRRTTA